MKPQLLEYLVRACTREVLKQVNENAMQDFFSKIPEKDVQFIEDLMQNQGLSFEQAVKDYLEMYGANQTGKPIKFDDQPSHIGRRFNEEEETKGAPAPPADGQGTADQPAIPKAEPKPEEQPKAEQPPKPEPKPKPKEFKGINIVNPRDKSNVKKVVLQTKDDASIERELRRLGSSLSGSKVKVALSTMRAVKAANPNTPLFLYIGKYDPQSEELFVLADNSLQVAKDSSAEPESLATAQPGNTTVAPFNPTMATANDFSQRMANAGQTMPQSIDENLHRMIKKMVNSVLQPK